MARQPAWTRESAIDYLAEQKLLTKSPEEYTTPYLKRLASSARKAEQQGREFTRQEARGHARAKIEHIEKDPKKHHIDQYIIRSKPGQDLTIPDLKNLVKKTKDQPDRIKMAIRGVVYDSDPKNANKEPEVQTYSFNVRHQDVRAWLKENPKGDILQFAFDATGLVWLSVSMVSFGYPESFKAAERRFA